MQAFLHNSKSFCNFYSLQETGRESISTSDHAQSRDDGRSSEDGAERSGSSGGGAGAGGTHDDIR